MLIYAARLSKNLIASCLFEWTTRHFLHSASMEGKQNLLIYYSWPQKTPNQTFSAMFHLRRSCKRVDSHTITYYSQWKVKGHMITPIYILLLINYGGLEPIPAVRGWKMGYTMGRFPADFKGTFRNERNEFVIQYFHHQGREFYHVGSLICFLSFTPLVLLPLPADA